MKLTPKQERLVGLMGREEWQYVPLALTEVLEEINDLTTQTQERNDAGSEPKYEAGTETCEICGCENGEHYSTCTIGFPESSLGRTGE